MNIVDNHNLLTQQQNDLLQESAAKPFQLGKFSSLEDILTSLHVRVFIEPGIPERELPPFLEEAENYWREKANKLEKEINKREGAEAEYREAWRKVEEICSEKYRYPMRIRGLYDPEDNVIKLFPEEMKTEYNGGRMNELLVSTLAHEAMHAYFNRYPKDSLPYA